MASLSPETAPRLDEVEVSIFGPGKGEAIAVHLGGGDWITVDSCRNQLTQGHATLEYFERIGVDPAQIRLVVGTHAHDDHVAGIADLYSAASTAVYVTSPALTSEEFLAEIVRDEELDALLNQAVLREYRAVFAEALRRARGADTPSLRHAIQQLVLWSRPAAPGLPAARVVSLSPSDRSVRKSMENLAKGTAQEGERRKLKAGDPNEYAIALWVEVGIIRILLGADLVVGPAGCGWRAVVATHRPDARASLYKVPHHGSDNADHDPVWRDLLTDDVVALVAPFRGGPKARPAPEDVTRIVSKSAAAYATAKANLHAQPAAVRQTSQKLRDVASNVREPDGRPGQVRARRGVADADWEIKLFDPALQLR